MASFISSTALFQEVDERIRQRIFKRELKPGERIDEQALARDFGISRTPLREALKVLHNEGLVKLVPRRGCFVAEVSDRDLDEIYEMVALLESAAAARAAELATPADVAKLRRVTRRMAQMAAEGQHRRYFDANLAAHELVLEIAGNRWQKGMIQYLRAICRLSPYVSIGKIPGRLEQSLREHEELLVAIAAHDPERSREVMHRHVVHTRLALRKLRNA